MTGIPKYTPPYGSASGGIAEITSPDESITVAGDQADTTLEAVPTYPAITSGDSSINIGGTPAAPDISVAAVYHAPTSDAGQIEVNGIDIELDLPSTGSPSAAGDYGPIAIGTGAPACTEVDNQGNVTVIDSTGEVWRKLLLSDPVDSGYQVSVSNLPPPNPFSLGSTWFAAVDSTATTILDIFILGQLYTTYTAAGVIVAGSITCSSNGRYWLLYSAAGYQLIELS